jgi:hypothetical protein
MPQRNKVLYFVGKLVFLALLGWAVALMRIVRRSDGWDEWSPAEDDWMPQPVSDDDEGNDEPAAAARKSPRRRIAVSLTFATLFFAGASFTAGAGDMVAKALEPAECAALMAATGEGEDVCVPSQSEALDAPAADAAAAEAAEAAEASAATDPEAEVPAADAQPAEAAAAPEAESNAWDGESAGSPDASSASTSDATGSETSASSDASAPSTGAAEQADEPLVLDVPQPPTATKGPKTRHWVVRRAREARAKAPVIEHEGGAPTVWLNRALPDPTPPAKRLSPKFAKKLRHISAVNGVSWALVLAVLRVEGATERVPATVRELNTLAKGLRVRGAADSEWNAALALSGRTSFADRVVAVARYNRAVGLGALIKGLEAAKPRLTQELLTDSRADIYGGGRDDMVNGRVDVRVIVLIKYLAETYGQVTVSSLFSGHRKYARPGVVSAHIYGQAVDIASLGGLPIMGHQEPGGITEKAVRAILLLPTELQPRQVISLLGLGGPSFPMGNRDEHIHVGY